MKIKYRNFNNPSQEFEVKQILEELELLIPCTTLRLNVHKWDSKEGDSSANASIEESQEYHFATLNIYNKFFSLQDEERVKCIVHEIVHLWANQIFDFVYADMVEYIKEHNGPLAEQFRRTLSVREEGFVEQMSYLIMELHSGNKWI